MPSTTAPSTRTPLWRTVLTPPAVLQLGLGWAGVLALALLGDALAPPLPGIVTLLALLGIVAVILIAAFGVVRQAEALAHRLGDPYGTLVLTLSIVVIEVVLIAAVMLGPGEHTTIARDSIMAVSMIIMNLVLGACLLVGGIRHGSRQVSRTGTSAYLVLLIVLSGLAFALPGMVGAEGAFTTGQALVIIPLTIAVYAVFLWRQTGPQAADFQEAQSSPAAESTADAGRSASLREVLATHRGELLARTGLLIATVLPIILLSHDMAALLDDGLERLGAPVALSGVLIAMIVFTPETITALRAAWGGEMQRVVNLNHGALVSSLALTIPTVLVIALLTGQQVVFAESAANLLLLGLTFAVAAVTAAAPRVTALHGAVHLVLFAVYAMVLFS